MLILVTTSSPRLNQLQFLPALPLLYTLCIYAVGFILAYVAFLLDRKAAIQSMKGSLCTDSAVTAPTRSAQMTSFDRREALLAAAIWPALLLVTLLCPAWVAVWRYCERRPKSHLRRTANTAHSMSSGQFVDESEQDRAARGQVLASLGALHTMPSTDDSASRKPESGQAPQRSEGADVCEAESTSPATSGPEERFQDWPERLSARRKVAA